MNTDQQPATEAETLPQLIDINSPEFQHHLMAYATQLMDATSPEFQALVQETAMSLMPGSIAPAHTAFTRSPIGTVRIATDKGDLLYECSCEVKTGTLVVRSNESGKWFVLPLPLLVAMAQMKGVDVRESVLHTPHTQGLIITA